MNTKNLKIILGILLSASLFACDGININSDYGSSSSESSDEKNVRGPTGGGAGGSLLFANGDPVINEEFSLYIIENGKRQLIFSGTTNEEGKVDIPEGEISDEIIEKLDSNETTLAIEVGNENIEGKLVLESEKELKT